MQQLIPMLIHMDQFSGDQLSRDQLWGLNCRGLNCCGEMVLLSLFVFRFSKRELNAFDVKIKILFLIFNNFNLFIVRIK